MPEKTTAKPAQKRKSAEVSNSAIALQKALGGIQKSTSLKPFDAPSTTLPHVPTGSTNIDILIGGSLAHDGKPLCPGFPRRRITEVYGPESSGKTTLLLSAIAQLQKRGGSALFVDFEHHISKKYAIDIGVQWNEPTFAVIQPRTLQEGLKAMYFAIATGVDLIGVDSVAAMVPATEMEKKFDDPSKIGAVAAAFSTVLPRFGIWLDEHPMSNDKTIEGHPGTAVVLLNQIRSLIQTGGGGGHGDGENTTGGKALKFYSTLRLRLSRIKSETIKRKDPMSGREITVPYGNLTHVKIVKSKLDGKQNHTTQIFIRYGYGVDDFFSIIEGGVTNKLIKKEGAFLTLDGERFQGRDKFRKFLIDNPKAFEALKQKTLDLVIAGSTPVDPNAEIGENDQIMEMAARDLGDLDEDKDDDDLGLGGIPEEVVEAPEDEVSAAEA